MSQKTDNLIKLALVFFVSLLSFSIGTYVGKKYSDNQHKLALLEPKKDTAAPHAEEFASDTDGEKPMNVTTAGTTANEMPSQLQQKPAALTDSEVAKIAEEFASEEESAEEKIVSSIEPDEKDVPVVANTPKPVAKAAPAPVAAAPVLQKAGSLPAKMAALKAAAERIAPTPTEDVTDERLPASIPAAKTEVTPMHFTVQIGSFPTQEEAEKMTKALQNKGYKTSFVPAKVNGQFWYRVNVGLFGTIREAQDYKKEFLEKTNLTSAIVQRVQE